MRDEQQEAILRRRASLFIVAVMTFALVYMYVQIFQDSGETRLPPSVAHSAAAAHRIVLELPVGDWLGEAPPDALSSRLRSAGVLWATVRVPLWTPTTRRTEYSRGDLTDLSRRVRALREAGLRIILAPVYWNGEECTPRPSKKMPGSFFSTYRELSEEIATFATHCGADALLLDGVFGDPSVSVSEWLDLLASLRATYPGMIEARMDEGLTPPMYLVHMNGAYIANDTTRFIEIHSALPAWRNAVPIYFTMPDPDRYASGYEPWKPMLSTSTDHRAAILALLSSANGAHPPRGLVLSGKAITDALLSDSENDNDITSALRSLRQRRLVEDLERRKVESLR